MEDIYYNVRKTGKGVAREVLRLYKKHPDIFARRKLGLDAARQSTADPERACHFCVLGLASLVAGEEKIHYATGNKAWKDFVLLFNKTAKKLGYLPENILDTSYCNTYTVNDDKGLEGVELVLKKAIK